MTARTAVLFSLLALVMAGLVAKLYVSYRRWDAEVSKAKSVVREAQEALARRSDNGRPPESLPELGLADSIEIAGRAVKLGLSRNAIEFHGLACSIAQELDAGGDDGDFRTGRIRASVETCAAGTTNDPVPTLTIGLR